MLNEHITGVGKSDLPMHLITELINLIKRTYCKMKISQAFLKQLILLSDSKSHPLILELSNGKLNLTVQNLDEDYFSSYPKRGLLLGAKFHANAPFFVKSEITR